MFQVIVSVCCCLLSDPSGGVCCPMPAGLVWVFNGVLGCGTAVLCNRVSRRCICRDDVCIVMLGLFHVYAEICSLLCRALSVYMQRWCVCVYAEMCVLCHALLLLCNLDMVLLWWLYRQNKLCVYNIQLKQMYLGVSVWFNYSAPSVV